MLTESAGEGEGMGRGERVTPRPASPVASEVAFRVIERQEGEADRAPTFPFVSVGF